MRALIVSDSYPPLIGGATQASHELAHEFAGRGHDVVVATSWQPQAPDCERERSGVLVVRIRATASRLPGTVVEPRYTPPPFPDPGLVRGLRKIIREHDPDLVHAYGWMAGSCAVAMIGNDVPFVVCARDYANICARRTLLQDGAIPCSGPALGKCLACAKREYGSAKGTVGVAAVLGAKKLLARSMTALHSVSRYVEAVMEDDLLPADRSVQTIVAPDWRVEPTDPADPSILNQLPTRPFILYVGALRRVKGIDELLRAYRALDSPPPLVLIGTVAPDTPTLPDDVVVLRDVPFRTVLEAWGRALFGVAPSIWPEPLGNVVHEAMSRGKTVVGTKPGGHADMIEDGVSGLLVDSGDVGALTAAMKFLIDHPEQRKRMENAALIASARFSHASAVDPLLDFLEEVSVKHRG